MSFNSIVIIIVIILAIIFGFYIYGLILQAQSIESAKCKYLESLAELKLNPTNADIKQETLELGRSYFNLARQGNGRTIFDEVALMNDINAASMSNGGHTDQQPTNLTASTKGIVERLNTLSQLKEKGLLDNIEYEKRRSEILENI